jgi:2-polyprenyl-3-methyl-5-hydroxy-6-metoxy-1,4-benzoquinol methylase
MEIGAGIGVVGIYAALCGHNVTITDMNDDALLFARAGALLNKCPQVEVRKLDWARPDLPYRYDVIVGSEVIYDRENYPVLVNFLRQALEPNGVIFLAKNARLPTPKFLPELTKHFMFKEKTHSIRSEGETQQITLYAIRPKNLEQKIP